MRSGEPDRILVLAITCSLGFLALMGQLWYLQVLEGGRMHELSEKNGGLDQQIELVRTEVPK